MRRATILAVVLALGACSSGEPDLIRFRADDNDRGPDEFAIVPSQPLSLEGLPESVAALPAPQPGGVNLTDPTPIADAYAALGGSLAAADRPADGGIVNYAARGGINPNIRAELAADDYLQRKRRPGRVLERIFGTTTYYDAYAAQSLDQYGELSRVRRAGLRNPAAPPPDVELPARRTATDGPSFYDPSPLVSGR